jgi:LysR family hydrogen peroxide-inducible transcriptional activator
VLCRKGDELSRVRRVKHSALRAEDVWLLEEGHCLRSQVLDVCAVRKKAAVARAFQFESGSLETLKNLVSSVGGYTLLPALATDHLPGNVALVPFERPVPAREIGFVFRREHYKLALQDALREAVVECVPAELRKMRKGELEVLPVEG